MELVRLPCGQPKSAIPVLQVQPITFSRRSFFCASLYNDCLADAATQTSVLCQIMAVSQILLQNSWRRCLHGQLTPNGQYLKLVRPGESRVRSVQCEIDIFEYLICKVVHCEVQLVADAACWLLCAHHELVKLPLAHGPLLPVVLLVAAMELHQLPSLLIYVGGLTDQL